MCEFNLRVLCYYDNIAINNGIDPNKTPDVTDEPKRKINRAEFAQMLVEKKKREEEQKANNG